VLQYCDATGNINEQSNPNGSMKNIAGIINKKGNVFGLMPHPERAADSLLGGIDGSLIFKSLK
jgi:phosphoribosylformylglycinamidine synthase